MVSGLPRHAINRLVALHIVSGMVEAFAHPVRTQLDESERGKAAILASRIAMSAERAKLLDPHDATDSRLVNTILRRNDVMTRNLGDEVDARRVLAMVIALVAECEEAIPREPKLLGKRMEWGALHTMLGEFLEIVDAGLTDDEELYIGCAVGARMLTA